MLQLRKVTIAETSKRRDVAAPKQKRRNGARPVVTRRNDVSRNIHHIHPLSSLRDGSWLSSYVNELGNDVSENTQEAGEADSFPVFSNEPMTVEECGLQFTTNCASPMSCTGSKAFNIGCREEVTTSELTAIIAAMPRSTPRATRVQLYDGVYVSFSTFAPIRSQIVMFFIQNCRDSRTTGKLSELRLYNLLDFDLKYCYNLKILKKDFRHTYKLRVFILYDSTVLTLERGTFSDLPALRIVTLEFRLDKMAVFSPEIHNHVFRLHCSCEFAWYRRWWENNTALLRQAKKGDIYLLPVMWESKTLPVMVENREHTKSEMYLPVDCAAFPSGADSINFDQDEFSVNEEQSLS